MKKALIPFIRFIFLTTLVYASGFYGDVIRYDTEEGVGGAKVKWVGAATDSDFTTKDGGYWKAGQPDGDYLIWASATIEGQLLVSTVKDTTTSDNKVRIDHVLSPSIPK